MDLPRIVDHGMTAKKHRHCHTCKPEKDPYKHYNDKYADHGWHEGGSSAGKDQAQDDQYEMRQDGLKRASYVEQGGASITARDGGYHFGGSYDENGKELVDTAGRHDGYTGALEQSSAPDCVNVATANKLAETNGLSPEETQRQLYANELGTTGASDSVTAARKFGYTDVEVDTTANVDKLASQPDRAMGLGVDSPNYYKTTDPAYASTMTTTQAKYGIDLVGDGKDTSGHEFTVDRVYTGDNGATMLTVSNPHGSTFQIPASQLHDLGVGDITYGTPPAR